MKRKKAINFLTVTLFIGILLTFTVYIGVGTLFDADADEGDKKGFNQMFYSENFLSDLVRYVDYKVFGHIDGEGYIIGEDDWVFEAVDSQNGYERLLDYVGACPFEEEELDRISNVIANRAELYENAGVQYVLVVIPDAMTVCTDKVPGYLGDRSESARLAQLTARLAGQGVDEFIDPTDAMRLGADGIVTYNNTENSINAYGAYCIYNTVVSKFMADTGLEVERLKRNDVDFYTRLTDGKTVARNAGVQGIIKNSTVSLSDNVTKNYTVLPSVGGAVQTRRDDAGENSTEYSVVVECTNSWDRILLTPYFSNTFDNVMYRDRLASDYYSASSSGVDLVVQLIRESELRQLLG